MRTIFVDQVELLKPNAFILTADGLLLCIEDGYCNDSGTILASDSTGEMHELILSEISTIEEN